MDYHIHIFDAIARDQKRTRAIDTETKEEIIEVEYISDDEDNDSDDGQTYGKKYKKRGSAQHVGGDQRELIIYLFGRTSEGESVRLEVTNFRPYFFVALPMGDQESISSTDEIRLKAKIEAKVKGTKTFNKLSSSLKFELVHKQKLYGYTGGKKYPFVKISLPSMSSFYEMRKLFLEGENQIPIFRLSDREQPLDVYEATIDPMLRFFHTQDINPCGWVTVKKSLTQTFDSEDTLLLGASYEDVKAAAYPVIRGQAMISAAFKHAFWDIECYSHDGEFPMPRQGYRRVAKQLWALAKTSEECAELLVKGFSSLSSGVASELTIPPLKPGTKVSEKKIRSLVQSVAERLTPIWNGYSSSLGVKEKELRIKELTEILDKIFGNSLAGDPIIQIGTTKWIAGESASEKHIFVLGDCDPVDNAILHVSKTEKDLLLSWFAWCIEENFDVFVGYNIFGFDEKYVWERLVELGIEEEEVVQAMTRLHGEGGSMKLQEKFLSSSALGDNVLQMWTTPGRLRIDLYSFIKRKTPLPSYKLDAVAAMYLSGKLSGIESVSTEKRLWLLKTTQAGDARVGRSVQVLNDLGEELTEKLLIRKVVEGGIVVESTGDSEEDLSIIESSAERWAIVKDDISPQEIFKLHRGTSADRAKVAAYCVQDCDLVLELYRKLGIFNEAMSMANVCSVPVGYIFTRGQGIKIESLIFKDCMIKGQLIQVLRKSLVNEDSYEGAIVLVPEPGFYTKAPVGVCDFASLYPSTIISENISHDMLVWTKDFNNDGTLICVKYGSDKAERHAPVGTRFTDIEFDIWRANPEDTRKTPEKIKVGVRVCRYAQPLNNEKGSLPQIVAKLLAARKAKRDEIKKTSDPFKKELLDAEQNAYKVTANSLYGQLGSPTFKIRLQHLAASVTAYGRKQILFAKEAIEKFYGPEANDPRCTADAAKIVYGDSVKGDTPLYLKTGDVASIQRIDELAGHWLPWHETKEAVDVSDSDLKIWTEKGWTSVKRIIRHRLSPGKKMYRVLTHTGVVDCTEDHSLVSADGASVKPNDVKVGTPLLHNDEIHKEFKEVLTEEQPNEKEAWAWGFFLADGSSDVYNCASGKKATWAINKADTSLLEKASESLPFKTKILDTLESSGVYKLVAQGDVITQAIKYRSLFYNDAREKRVPPCILTAPLKVVEAFMAGFYAGDGDKANGFGYTRWDQKGKEVCAGLYVLSRRLGFNVSINDRLSKPDVFRLTLSKNSYRKSPIQIKKMREISTEDVEFVYDLETENHHFAVGPGALVVHNTDSLFVCFNPRDTVTGVALTGREAIVATIELTEEAGKFITGALKAPHDFEYDKVFYPFIIFSKKRYVGNKYEESPDKYKETSMGIVLKRRDNAPLLKTIYSGALDRLLNYNDVLGAVSLVKEKVMDLVKGKMTMSQLTITKSLASDYVNAPAHKILADRITARDPGNAPASGDRIGFIYIKPTVGQQASKIQGERIETPSYIESKGLKPDAEYYIHHQLLNPLSQLFGSLVEQIPGFKIPSAGWSKDMDMQIIQREQIAADLLFNDGLKACNQSSKNEFAKQFGFQTRSAIPSASASASGYGSPSVKVEEKKKQMSMDAFLLPGAYSFSDGYLAKSMRLAKAAKGKKEKENEKKE